jgi:hypothetical protein
VRIIGLLVLTLIGCKDNTAPVAPPGSGSAPPPITSTGSAAQPAKPAKQPLQLPKLSGKPAAKTKVKHTKPQLEALSKLEFPDWTRDVRKIDTHFLTVKQATSIRPKLAVTVSILPCTGKCWPLQADKWRAEQEALKVTLAPELHNRPDTTFEVGETTLGGQKVIYVYQLAQHFGKDENGNPSGAYSNAYILYHHDGLNQIRVVAEYVDDPLGSKDDLARAVPREHLEKVGIAFLDAYAQAWAN